MASLAMTVLLSVATERSPAAPANVPAPGLNHVYVVLDAETFAAVRDSAGLRALLGPSDAGLPDYSAPAADADRVFLRGKTGYLELFAPDNRFGEPVGKVGIAVGTDDRAGFDRLSAAWRAHCGAGFRVDAVSFRRVEPPIPWYDAVQCDAMATGPHIAVWAMIYRTEFARWQTGGETVARSAVLALRRAAGQGRFDISEITIDMVPEEGERLAAQLAAAGLVRTDGPGGTRLAGDGWVLMLRRASGAPGLRSMRFVVDGGQTRSVPLGQARIDAHRNGDATLSFAPHG